MGGDESIEDPREWAREWNVKAKTAGQNAGVDEKDAAKGEGPACCGEAEVADCPERWYRQKDCRVEALVGRQEADDQDGREYE